MTAVSSSFLPLPGDFFNRADVENRRRLERKAQSRGVKLKRLRIITRSQPACVPAGRRSGQNDRLLRLPGPQIYRRTRVGPWVFDQPSDSSSQESVCQIRRVNIKYWFSQISLGHLPNNEIPFEQQTSSTPSQDGGPSDERWNIANPRRRGENTQTPHRTAHWGFKPAAFLPLGATPREAERVATGIGCHVTPVERHSISDWGIIPLYFLCAPRPQQRNTSFLHVYERRS